MLGSHFIAKCFDKLSVVDIRILRYLVYLRKIQNLLKMFFTTKIYVVI